MTIGQRIAEKRKERGLSQEALGESLGVTRQSISKWEGDVTLPEIDKLIAMSRLFGVSVGWLLGEEKETAAETAEQMETAEQPESTEQPETAEEPETAEQSEAETPEELTGEQLRLVEEIVERYIAAQPKPALKRRQLLGAGAAAAALCMVFALLSLSRQVRRLEEQNQYLQQAINNVNHSVSSQISGITSQVEETLRAQGDLTAQYRVEKTKVDYRGNTVTFQLQATPKISEQGMTVVFLADNGLDTVQAAGAKSPGQSFEAPLTCPLTDTIDIYLVIRHPDGTEEQQFLDRFRGLYSGSIPRWSLQDDEELLANGTVENGWLTVPEGVLFVMPEYYDEGMAAAKRVQVGLFKNQNLVEWCEAVDMPANYHGFDNCFFFQMKERSVIADPSDKFCFALVLTDEYDRVFVCGGAELFEGGSAAVRVTDTYDSSYEEMRDWGLTKEFVERSPGHRF